MTYFYTGEHNSQPDKIPGFPYSQSASDGARKPLKDGQRLYRPCRPLGIVIDSEPASHLLRKCKKHRL
jgi:hypothetical protein